MNDEDRTYMEIREIEMEKNGLFVAPEIRPTRRQPLLKWLAQIFLQMIRLAPEPGRGTRAV